MSGPVVPAESEAPVSELAITGKIILAGAVGAVVGLVAAGLPFGSVVVGIFGALAGAVGGMIVAARSTEPA